MAIVLATHPGAGQPLGHALRTWYIGVTLVARDAAEMAL